ncbi:MULTISPECIES: glucose-6-phosphate isomerase [Ruminococcus]|uniref:Glucose-6-phosphate isomerase n=1 Tax=Ruminococcus flavefaciens TaxID=1265 RepID=A0A1M7H3C8_RUMFL|nr:MULTISPECIES: glucose-6-phosphate isomerase [Ruminococcus]MCR4795195.1 glucose-6-phosphate isomerase [Ruminococcus sp.]SHM22876.1 glucose-6-phosphate isomerase [Ruminococcus flavefaciens]
MSLKLNTKYLKDFVNADELAGIKAQVEAAAQSLQNKTGLGNDFLGWVDLPTAYDKEEFSRIKAAAERIKKNSDILIVIGIGGSYLGARAAIELLKSPLYNNMKKDTPDIYYVGNSINPAYLNEIIALCEGKDFSVNVISKSGTTTEPALAFRIFKKMVEDKYGKEEAKNRIFATTDKARGTLKNLSDTEGYETFVIPDDVGGRFSVLTAVGLLPIAVAGCDIDALMKGAAKAQADFCADFDNNDCYKYAALRNILYRKGKSVEMLVSYDPSFVMMSEWYKQLFGESEGKDNKGIFPSAAVFSTDLHSMGQYIQDGARILFETVVDIKKPKTDLFLEADAENLDGLNFLTNQNMSVVNRKAFEGTVLAHTEGGVPNIILELDDTTEESVGYMIYFFEKACAISGYVLGVNPFNQPGVESYKSNMFALLGKPGYEGAKAALEAKLG